MNLVKCFYEKDIGIILVLICMLSLVACDKATGSEETITNSKVSDTPEIDKNVSGETGQTQQAIVERISGTFNDKENNQNLPVTAEEKESINVILAQYITLGLE